MSDIKVGDVVFVAWLRPEPKYRRFFNAVCHVIDVIEDTAVVEMCGFEGTWFWSVINLSHTPVILEDDNATFYNNPIRLF